MALMDQAVWRGQIHSGGWVDGGGGDAPVVEPGILTPVPVLA